jgi:hypothetical protein
MRVEPAAETAEHAIRDRIAADSGIFICCAGYEERALHSARVVGRPKSGLLFVIRLIGGDAANDAAFAAAQRHFGVLAGNEVIDYDLGRIPAAGQELARAFSKVVLAHHQKIYVDISGLPGHGICQLLFALRERFKSNSIVCIYTAAAEYYPQKSEYLKSLTPDGRFDADALPESLTYEAADNLILPAFQGFSVKQERTCLFLLAGFEKHRSVTVVESINPTRLVLVYGTPPSAELRWREDLSRKLHADLFTNVPRAEEAVVTADIPQLCTLFEEYYSMLYDDMSIVLCPINSKLQTVATYLFWERYRDVQLCFPLPVQYLPSRSSLGCGAIFTFTFPPVPQVQAFLGT